MSSLFRWLLPSVCSAKLHVGFEVAEGAITKSRDMPEGFWKAEKKEASKLQSDIMLKLVVSVRDNKNDCPGVRLEAHLPHTLA